MELLDGIGSTEALHIFLSTGRAGRPGTTGEVVAGYELRIEDADGNPVPDGEPGGLWVRGDSVATGYWCRFAVTRRVFRGEWLRTGDIYSRTPTATTPAGPHRRRDEGQRDVGIADRGGDPAARAPRGACRLVAAPMGTGWRSPSPYVVLRPRAAAARAHRVQPGRPGRV